MTKLKTLALAAAAIAGLGLYSTTDAEARGFGGRGGGFHGRGFHGGGFHGHRHFGHRHFHGHGRWIGLGVVGTAVAVSSCYRVRWVDTPYGLVRRTVNVCAY